MPNKTEYIHRLERAIMQSCHCSATWRESVYVHKIILGETLWDSDVEVFELTGHAQAKRAYGWSHPAGDDNQGERLVAVPGIPPVDSPQAAVQVSLVSDLQAGRI